MRFITFLVFVIAFGAAVASVAVDGVEAAKANAEARMSALEAL
jgi:hypothetical protein